MTLLFRSGLFKALFLFIALSHGGCKNKKEDSTECPTYSVGAGLMSVSSHYEGHFHFSGYQGLVDEDGRLLASTNVIGSAAAMGTNEPVDFSVVWTQEGDERVQVALTTDEGLQGLSMGAAKVAPDGTIYRATSEGVFRWTETLEVGWYVERPQIHDVAGGGLDYLYHSPTRRLYELKYGGFEHYTYLWDADEFTGLFDPNEQEKNVHDLQRPGTTYQGGTHMMLDPTDGNIVLAYRENGALPHMEKWLQDEEWLDYGQPDAVQTNTRPFFAAIGPDGRPVAAPAFADTWPVRRWVSGQDWEDLGYPHSDDEVILAIAVDPQTSEPLVLVLKTDNTLSLVTYAGNEIWNDSPLPQTLINTSFIDLVFQPDTDQLFLAAGYGQNDDGRVRILRRESNSSWTDLGVPCDDRHMDLNLAFHPDDMQPVLPCADTVVKLNAGDQWETLVDTSSFLTATTNGYVQDIDVAFEDDGSPVVFMNMTLHIWGEHIHGEWQPMGNPMSFDPAQDLDYRRRILHDDRLMALDSEQRPVLLARNPTSGALSVHRWLQGEQWEDLGTVSDEVTTDIGLVLDGQDNPLVGYRGETTDEGRVSAVRIF
ncbi:MAG: hypothetical protein HN348_23620, partial [Proteobacteria bacterium]|nr:hypothetical protein [Pseudomonadota bacterium]